MAMQQQFPPRLYYVFAGMEEDSDYDERSHFDAHIGKIVLAKLQKVYAPGEWDQMDEYIGEYDDPLVRDVHVSLDMIDTGTLCDPYGFNIYIFTDKNRAMMKSKELLSDDTMGRGYNIDMLTEIISKAVRKAVNEMATVKGGMYNDKELNFTHFAINKTTGKIVNGWDYSEYDSEDLRREPNYFFGQDLKDNDLDPKQYKILGWKGCKKAGIDPNDNTCWSNV